MAWQPITMTISGLGPLKRNLERLGEDAPKILGRGLKQEAGGVIDTAKPFVPYRTGELRRSGTVGRIRYQRGVGQVIVDAAFGSKRAWYAIIVHERLDRRHTAPTRAKFLESAFDQRRRGVVGRLVRFIRLQLLRRFGATD